MKFNDLEETTTSALNNAGGKISKISDSLEEINRKLNQLLEKIGQIDEHIFIDLCRVLERDVGNEISRQLDYSNEKLDDMINALDYLKEIRVSLKEISKYTCEMSVK